MRDFKGMKRQRSRNRNTGNGGKPQHNANRAFESNGPDGVKIRGAAQHVFEKYQQLARDALTAGDRVLGESYQQHAEHYFRVLRAVQPNRPASDIIGRDAFASGYDIDFEDDGEVNDGGQDGGEVEPDRVEGRSNEWRPDPRYETRRDERPRDENRPRDDRPREDRNRDDRNRDRNGGRDDRPRDERPRDDRPRDERPRDERPRDDRPRNDRNDRSRDDRRYERSDKASDPLAVVEPQASPLTNESAGAPSPLLRSQDGDFSHAPAFLQPRAEASRPEAAAEAEASPRPRRRRAPRNFEGSNGEGAAPVDASEDA